MSARVDDSKMVIRPAHQKYERREVRGEITPGGSNAGQGDIAAASGVAEILHCVAPERGRGQERFDPLQLGRTVFDSEQHGE